MPTLILAIEFNSDEFIPATHLHRNLIGTVQNILELVSGESTLTSQMINEEVSAAEVCFPSINTMNSPYEYNITPAQDVFPDAVTMAKVLHWLHSDPAEPEHSGSGTVPNPDELMSASGVERLENDCAN